MTIVSICAVHANAKRLVRVHHEVDLLSGLRQDLLWRVEDLGGAGDAGLDNVVAGARFGRVGGGVRHLVVADSTW